MTPQGLLLGLLIAAACGLLYHLIRGGPLRRMAAFVVTACLSFFSGHFVGGWVGLTAPRLGTLNLLPALVATALGLIGTDFLARAGEAATDGGLPRNPADEDD